jgi:lysozyme family protein
MAQFEIAIIYVHPNEGGYRNDPDDPGGETNFGICKRDHPGVDIKNLTIEGADAIYREQYWCYDGISSQELATKLLDWAINLEGTGKRGEAVKALQLAILVQEPATIVADGCYGPSTEAMCGHCDADGLLRDMMRIIGSYREGQVARNPRLTKYMKGWTARDHRLPTDGLPSAADMDAVAAEQEARTRTAAANG